MTDKMYSLQECLAQLKEKYGSLGKAAEALDMDPQYIWRLSGGFIHRPTEKTLEKMGLRKVEGYQWTKDDADSTEIVR